MIINIIARLLRYFAWFVRFLLCLIFFSCKYTLLYFFCTINATVRRHFVLQFTDVNKPPRWCNAWRVWFECGRSWVLYNISYFLLICQQTCLIHVSDLLDASVYISPKNQTFQPFRPQISQLRTIYHGWCQFRDTGLVLWTSSLYI